jgi:hypothetical protein
MDYGSLGGANEAYQAGLSNQVAEKSANSAAAASRAASKSSSRSSLFSSLAAVAAAKITVGACLPKGIYIDVPNGKKLIEDIQAGDMVVGYDGKPVSVLQKHCYKEDPKNTFYNIKMEHDNKVGTVNVGGWHKVLNVPAPDIKEEDPNVINKKEYKGVKFSYDLLTEDAGYRIDGIPVNSMIGEMAEMITKLNKK